MFKRIQYWKNSGAEHYSSFEGNEGGIIAHFFAAMDDTQNRIIGSCNGEKLLSNCGSIWQELFVLYGILLLDNDRTPIRRIANDSLRLH